MIGALRNSSCRSARLMTGLSQARLFHQSVSRLNLDPEREKYIAYKLSILPKQKDIYQNDDGTPRAPSDEELKIIAELNALSGQRDLSLSETFSLGQYKNLYNANSKLLETLDISSARIIDKIPYEDTATGETKWLTVREGDDHKGFEGIVSYMLVPTLVLFLIVIAFREDMSVNDWAVRELVLRVKETAQLENDVEVLKELDSFGKPEEAFAVRRLGDKDSVFIERILSGEYDKLAGLKVKEKLPIFTQKD
ncbi:unnamed protein product [Kuraishia capsulata CBS 1993]|uniref:Uncharacterized protein n=1 Tax=Kuraishia capsulata CBS 1993 TaxID=1382522 RepID=W6MTL5_9ASCO|nr:uncharacterized protein KUCA_T00004510001 [Kuraishia capsulata CBS 1993]CDK28527.1 unnamed protein product [Kuraishia capsulata CBS 1993]